MVLTLKNRNEPIMNQRGSIYTVWWLTVTASLVRVIA